MKRKPPADVSEERVHVDKPGRAARAVRFRVREHIEKPVTSKLSTPGRWVWCEVCDELKRAKAPWKKAFCPGPRKRRVQWPDEVAR